MKRNLFGGLMLLSLLTGCTASVTSQTPPDPDAMLSPVILDNTVKLVVGQTVYVPIYSTIYTWEQSRIMNLTATLSVRNTDLTHPIVITAVRYHGDDGKLIRNYLEQPGQLNSLSSASFVVD